MRSVVCLTLALCGLAFFAPVKQVRAQDNSAAPVKLDYAAMNKLGWKLSCQAWTFRSISLFETIDNLKKLGIKYIELYQGQRLSPENPMGFDQNAPDNIIGEVIAKLKADGITPVNYGVVGLGPNEAEDRKVFEFAKKLKLQTIVSEPDPSAIAQEMPIINKLCNEYKINVAIHDHPKPDYYWNPKTVLQTIKGCSDRIGACADVGHWYRSGLVPLDCLKELKGHIISLHFKDVNSQMQDVPWGTGECNDAGMLQWLKNQHFHGVFSIEYETSATGSDLFNLVRQCCEWFSKECENLSKEK
jgi:sugar phosphate isomerase/epimerase